MKVDTEWFRQAIEKSPEGSLRGVARKLKNSAGKELNQQSLFLLIEGRREMTLPMVQQLADVLDVPVLEVLKRSGLRL